MMHLYQNTGKSAIPAGTGTVIFLVSMMFPAPLHFLQGFLITFPLPPQRRHVERIWKKPVLTVSYQDNFTSLEIELIRSVNLLPFHNKM